MLECLEPSICFRMELKATNGQQELIWPSRMEISSAPDIPSIRHRLDKSGNPVRIYTPVNPYRYNT